MTNKRTDPNLVRTVRNQRHEVSNQSPVMPSRSMGLLSAMNELISAYRKLILTLASRNEVVLIVLHNG